MVLVMSLNDKICGHILDSQQQEIVLDNSNYLLVVAGAGSGKTLTILGKIHYLINYKKIMPNDILCISFTRAASNSLREKIKKELNLEITVYTFHKLALQILKDNNLKFNISECNTLDLIVDKFFSFDILNYPLHMKLLLKYFGIGGSGNTKEEYLKFYRYEKAQIENLKKLIVTFISLFKCSNFRLEDFSLFLKKAKKTLLYFKYRKEKIFLIMALNIYIQYDLYLHDNNEIDFNDMIVCATECVEKYGSINNYKYVIIDEYQDTSLVRFRLIESILKKTSAKLMVVGDDFQSIYRFTGCELSLFLDFCFYFPGATVKKIENTYRNSQELITVAGNFVMKNKQQIFKNLVSSKHLKKPIKIFYYNHIQDDFCKLLKIIHNENQQPIMILGRNNKDINKVLSQTCKIQDDNKIMYKELPNLEIYYLTSHKSKGLEEENVAIINLTNDILGFPNGLKDEKVLRFVSMKKEKYLYSEERRLFYVALTRTKNSVYLYVPKKNKSCFVKELLRDYKNSIEIISRE